MYSRNPVPGIICAVLVVGLSLASTADANFTLFPGSGSAVIDGGPGDASGVANGQIVIDTPIAVPGTNGDIEFMGLVEHMLVGPIVNGIPSERYIRVTEIPAGFNNAGSPAQLANVSANPFSLPSSMVFAETPYSQLAVIPGPGQLPTLDLEIDGWLDTTGTLTGGERIAMEVSASTQWVDGVAGTPVAAEWTNPGQTTPTVTVFDFSSEQGDYDSQPGGLRLYLTGLELGAGGSFHFPTSIVAGSAVPEPTSLAILGAAAGLVMLRRRR